MSLKPSKFRDTRYICTFLAQKKKLGFAIQTANGKSPKKLKNAANLAVFLGFYEHNRTCICNGRQQS